VPVGADSLFTSILVLFLMLASVVSIIAASGWRMTRSLGFSMFGLYGLFVLQDLLFQYCVFTLPASMKPCQVVGAC
jgi:Ca2+/Na+ antiporter